MSKRLVATVSLSAIAMTLIALGVQLVSASISPFVLQPFVGGVVLIALGGAFILIGYWTGNPDLKLSPVDAIDIILIIVGIAITIIVAVGFIWFIVPIIPK
jgi:hypothetical protein